jgi:vacuolar iron transporter family protein
VDDAVATSAFEIVATHPPSTMLVPLTSAASLGFLAVLGAVGTKAGGAYILRATIRVTFWGALALGITAGIGKLFGTML